MSATGIEIAAERRAVGHGGARTGTGDEPGHLWAWDSPCSVRVHISTPSPLSLPTVAMFGGARLLLAFLLVATVIWSAQPMMTVVLGWSFVGAIDGQG